MSRPRWTEIERIYHAALALETGQRTAFLAKACRGDSELLGEVQSLLHYEERSRDFIEPAAANSNSEHGRLVRELRELQRVGTPGRFVGRTFGVYDIQELIAQGGMG